ncbi:hypothetical protein AB0E00_03250, partial [Streptomyces sp. NPDC048110]|uniref:hypothetical protein n=1 Tax=Streptomyces sp. NPDC048110 TaxID=3155483 RepID=UPI0033EF352C
MQPQGLKGLAFREGPLQPEFGPAVLHRRAIDSPDFSCWPSSAQLIEATLAQAHCWTAVPLGVDP